MSWGEYRLMSGFLNSNMEKLWLKIVSIQVIPPQVTETKMWRKFTISPIKTDEIPFWRSLAGDLQNVRNMPVNYNGGLEHVVDLSKVCAWVAHQRAVVVACVCLPGTVGYSYK
jgi:hypothetical protein